MQGLKIVIEATSTGYTQEVFIDGELYHTEKMSSDTDVYEGKLIQGSDTSFCEKIEEDGRDDLDVIADSIDFIGMQMVEAVAGLLD